MKDHSYLVIPKRNTLHESRLSLADAKLSKFERHKQVQEAKAARFESTENKDFLSWIQGSKFAGSRGASVSETGGITGVRVMEMSEPEAESMEKELKDFIVLRNYPLDVIKPKQTAGAKAALAPGDAWHLQSIGLELARQNGYNSTGQDITVAVMDTGIAESHPEIAGKVTKTLTFDSVNWTHTQLAGPSTDTSGHGTHVAGLICGNTVGVAPGARVANYQMIPYGQGHLSDFILALEIAAADPDIQVINMSAGIRGYYPEFAAALSALRYAGLLIVVATGNEGVDLTRSPGNFQEVLSVGAANAAKQIPPFSSSGTMVFDHVQYTVPDLVAPGAGVYSCIMNGSYEAWDGTSMATPIVSGLAALILELDPTISLLDLEAELRGACLNLAGTAPVRQGSGLVQVTRAPVAAGVAGGGGGAGGAGGA